MKWLFLLLPLILLAIPAFSEPIKMATTTIADCSASQTNPANHYCASTAVSINGYAGNNQYWGYFKFNVSEIPSSANITEVNISLRRSAYSNNGTDYILVYNTTNNWSEANLTWNVKPLQDALQSNTTLVNATVSDYYNFSITEAVKTAAAGDDILSLLVRWNRSGTAYNPQLAVWSNLAEDFRQPAIYYEYTINGCPSHEANGTWCDEWNYTYWCRYDGVANYTPCIDIYHESIANLWNFSQTAYTVYTLVTDSDCGIAHGACPANYMCRQMHVNDTYSPWIGKVQCWPFNGNGSVILIDENGTSTNETAIPQCTVYDFSNLTNQFSCFSANCHWCIASRTCVRTITDCPTCTNTSAICYDSTCHMIECSSGSGSGGTISDLGTTLNTSLGSPYGASIIAFLTSAVISLAIFMNLKDKRIEAFIVPFFIFMAGFSMPGVNFFPMWIYLVMVTFTGVLIFWKAKGG